MHTWPRRTRWTPTALLAAAALVVAGAAPAAADAVVNGLDDSIDSTYELMPLALSTGAGSTTIYVVPTDDDNDPGCNFDGPGETVTVGLTSDRPDVATVSPSTLVLSACGTAGATTVTVTPVGVGSANVTASVVAGTNKTGGTFSVGNARFTAKVAAVPNTPPTLAITGVEEGGQYPKGTLARPRCVATDPDDVPEPPHTTTWDAPLTAFSGPYAADNIGTRYAMCSYVDDFGVQVLARVGYSVVDDSAPVIQRTIDPDREETGWYRGDVSIDYTVFDNQSPSSLTIGADCVPVRVTQDTALSTFTCTATSAGGTRTVTTNIRRDATPPVVSPVTTVSGGGTVVDGWYTAPVDVTFAATDETSRFLVDERVVLTATQTLRTTGDGELEVRSPAFTDRAGNSSAVGAAVRTVKVDTTAPAPPTASLSTPANTAGWHREPVTVSFTGAGDQGSGVATCTAPVTVAAETAAQTVSGTCTDRAGHTGAATQVTVRLDQGAPVVTSAVVPTAGGSNGWHTRDAVVDFTATDALSGLVTATAQVTSSGEGAAVEVRSPAFTDRAGNTTPAGVVTTTVKVDTTAPAVPTFVGPVEDVHFGQTPATPTCASSDGGSGLASCVVTGGGSTVGTHTWTATATDLAGLTSSAQLTYRVLPWRTSGFQAPVDTGAGVVNGVKGGSTVPVRFELFAGTTELTSVQDVALRAVKRSCDPNVVVDEVELLASGSTSLRYDSVAGHFQYNWKTPAGAACYDLTMTARDGVTTSVATFRTR
jgi:hypothetical protein